MTTLKTLRQGKYFEIEINETDETKAKNKIEDMCKKLLVNLTIEDFEVFKN
jgi:phosphoribosylformylglycinamidine synthase